MFINKSKNWKKWDMPFHIQSLRQYSVYYFSAIIANELPALFLYLHVSFSEVTESYFWFKKLPILVLWDYKSGVSLGSPWLCYVAESLINL